MYIISISDFKKLTNKRLKEAELMFQNNRYDCAVYLSGYSIELMLKLNVCKLFKLSQGYPENRLELDTYPDGLKENFLIGLRQISLKTFRTHNLNDLLLISGKEFKIKNVLLIEWTEILYWDPELRYRIVNINKLKLQNLLNL